MRLHPTVQLGPAPAGSRRSRPPPLARTRSPVRRARPASRRAPKGVDDLDRVARRLEADWQTALRRHEAGVHRLFRDLRAAVRTRKVGAKKADALRKALEPRLKPKRGRAKDLRRVESALKAALERLS